MSKVGALVSARHEIRLGHLGETTSEAFVAQWLVDVGERVSAGQPIVEMVTDKITIEIASDVEGTLVEQRFAAEARVQSGEVLAVIELPP
jgi:pyruvate/2-oxoglutarate dehydrogenase complex dihydrolipoamide acyltransferase (E2) component